MDCAGKLKRVKKDLDQSIATLTSLQKSLLPAEKVSEEEEQQLTACSDTLDGLRVRTAAIRARKKRADNAKLTEEEAAAELWASRKSSAKELAWSGVKGAAGYVGKAAFTTALAYAASNIQDDITECKRKVELMQKKLHSMESDPVYKPYLAQNPGYSRRQHKIRRRATTKGGRKRKLYTGKRGGVYYRTKNRRVYVA